MRRLFVFILAIEFLSISYSLPAAAQSLCETTAAETCDYVQSLLAEREVFARRVSGGLNGTVLWVTNLNDNGPGSLRAVLAAAPSRSWIRFAVSGSIFLKSRLSLKSFTTLDGRGAGVKLKNYGLDLIDVHQVIISDVEISDVDPKASAEIQYQQDAIQIASKQFCFKDPSSTLGSYDVWINHVLLSNFGDGLLDAVCGSRYVTVSHSVFQNHDKAMLLGYDKSNEIVGDRDKRGLYAIHHSIFRNITQRIPRLSQGKLLFYNNLVENFGSYALGTADGGEALSENNIFFRQMAGANNGPYSHRNHLYEPLDQYGRICEIGNRYIAQASSPGFSDAITRFSISQYIAPTTDAWMERLKAFAGPRTTTPWNVVASSGFGTLRVPAFSSSAWTIVGGTLTTVAAPSRTVYATPRYTLTEDGTTGYHRLQNYARIDTQSMASWRFSMHVERVDVESLRVFVGNTLKQSPQHAVTQIRFGATPGLISQWQGPEMAAGSYTPKVTKLVAGGYLVEILISFPEPVNQIRVVIDGEQGGSNTYRGTAGRIIKISDIVLEPRY